MVLVDDLPDLAFDHDVIIEYALWRLRNKVEYSRIAHAFLGDTFTLAELREVHEAVLGRSLDPANFRRQIESSNSVVPTGKRVLGTSYRPPRLYRYNTSVAPVDRGELSIDVAERVRLEGLADVHARAAAGALRGKVVVVP